MNKHGRTLTSSLLLTLSLGALALTGCPTPANNDAGPDAVTTDTAAPDVVAPDATTLDVTPDAVVPDVLAPDAAVDAPLVDAPTEIALDAGPSCVLRNVVATTTTGSVGGYILGSVAARDLHVVMPPSGAMIPQDHVVRQSGCMLFDLWRTFAAGPNQLVIIDPAAPYVPVRTVTLPAMSPGADAAVQAADPYDVAVLAPDRAYVALYNLPSLLVLNPATGVMRGSISLAAFAGADGIPEATALAVANGRAFVALQQLDRAAGYTAPAHSTVVVVDTATDTLADLDATMAGAQSSIQLTFGNPGSMSLTPDGRLLLVASSGNFGSNTDGGIDIIDTMTGRVLRSVPASTLGGDPTSVTVLSATSAWVSLQRPAGDAGPDAGMETVVLDLNPTSGALDATPRVRSSSIQWGGLRVGPDGNVWAINTAFGADGTVGVFSPTGAAVGTPFTVATTGTYSLDFAP